METNMLPKEQRNRARKMIKKIHQYLIQQSIIKPISLTFYSTFSYCETMFSTGQPVKINISLEEPLLRKREGTLFQQMIQRYCHEVGHAIHFESDPVHAQTMGLISDSQTKLLMMLGLDKKYLQIAHHTTTHEQIAETLGQILWKQLQEDMQQLKGM